MRSTFKGLFICLALLILYSCSTTNWKPTSFYAEQHDFVQETVPVKGEQIVVIYTTSWCFWCKEAKRWMKKNKVSYVEQSVEDPRVKKKLKEYAKKIGYTGRLNAVPIFAINKKIIVGYNPEQILKEIGRRKTSVRNFTTWETPLKQ